MIFVNAFHDFNSGKVNEGGMSRNAGVYNWLKYNIKDFTEVKLPKNNIVRTTELLHTLIRNREQNIFLLYPFFGISMRNVKPINYLVRKAFFTVLHLIVNKYNSIYIDIPDLRYEQAIDLELESDRLPLYQSNENVLFTLGANYIFASETMRRYAIDKYGLKNEKTDVLINGASKIIKPIHIENGPLRIVYAGTLNKGRQIEQMTEILKNIRNVEVYLMGIQGEWIESTANIHYIGALEEDEAREFVSKCDIGLIPYDETRLYYNIAYPTKLSFYISAGIPILSTRVAEVETVVNGYHIGCCAEIEKWPEYINHLTRKDIDEMKQNMSTIQEKFTWDSICDHCDMLKKL